MSRIIDVAEAVKDELNAATVFTLKFRAERSYADWSAILDEDVLHVDVVPWNWIPSMDSRGTYNYQCEVDVLVRQRMGQATQATTGITQLGELDALMIFCEDVYEYFVPTQTLQDGRRLAAVPEAVLDVQSTKIMQAFVREHFRLHRQFTWWVRLAFDVQRILT